MSPKVPRTFGESPPRGRGPTAAAGDRGDDADLRAVIECLVQAAAVAHVHAVDVHVHERTQLALLVEQQAANGELAQRLAGARCLHLEPVPPARLGREQGRK